MAALLPVEDIHTAYGLSKVLFGITADISAGECVCLLGRNGVGKSTTMRSIMGLAPPQQRTDRSGRARTLPAGRRTVSRAPESAWCPKTGGSLPN